MGLGKKQETKTFQTNVGDVLYYTCTKYHRKMQRIIRPKKIAATKFDDKKLQILL